MTPAQETGVIATHRLAGLVPRGLWVDQLIYAQLVISRKGP
jgi:hypothetical protein